MYIKSRILEFLAQHNGQGWTSKEIALRLDCKYGSVSGLLSQLKKNGEVTEVPDSPAAKYYYRNEPSSKPNIREKLQERLEIIKQRRQEITKEEEKLAKEEEKLTTALEVFTELVV